MMLLELKENDQFYIHSRIKNAFNGFEIYLRVIDGKSWMIVCPEIQILLSWFIRFFIEFCFSFCLSFALFSAFFFADYLNIKKKI